MVRRPISRPARQAGASQTGASPSLDPAVYRTLADFRYLLRHFLAFSEASASAAGLTSRQHQALLAIKGFSGDTSPTIGDLAERLGIHHHSAVELVDRLVEAGMIVRNADDKDRRKALLGLTKTAEQRLASLSGAHLDELLRLRPALVQILDLVSVQVLAEGAPEADVVTTSPHPR
jgi:DNA-binding MarR family transcriptional regulator